MKSILKDISEGKSELQDIERLHRISLAMQKASLCGLGQTAANPVVSTLRYFEDEYKMHIVDKKCPSGKCKDLTSYTIVFEKCKRCSLCQRECPVGAIEGDRENGFQINEEKCIKCGRCFEVCRFDAVDLG